MFDKSSVVAMFDEHSQAEDAVKELQQVGSDIKKPSIVGALVGATVVSEVKAEPVRTRQLSRVRKA